MNSTTRNRTHWIKDVCIRLLTINLIVIGVPIYTQAQKFEWLGTIGSDITGLGEDVVSSGVIVAPDSNIYVVGQFEGATYDFDFSTAYYPATPEIVGSTYIQKLDNNSNLMWLATYGTATDYPPEVMDLDVDSSGLYLVGRFQETVDFDPGIGVYNLTALGGTWCGFMTKLDHDGNHLWTHQFGNANWDQVVSIDLDPYGNIILGGTFGGTVDFDPGPGVTELTYSDGNAFILKMSIDGQFEWVVNYGSYIGGGTQYIQPYVATDIHGNIYATGSVDNVNDLDPGPGVSTFTPEAYYDAYIIKLDSSGIFQWHRQIQGPSYELVRDAASDIFGNLYVAGVFVQYVDFDITASGVQLVGSSSLVGYDTFIVKYDSLGNTLWVKTITSPDGSEKPHLTLDDDGNVYTTGIVDGLADFDPGLDTSFLSEGSYIQILDSSGNYIWAGTLEGEYNIAYGNAVDQEKSIYICGAFDYTAEFDPDTATVELTSLGGSDAFVVKLSKCGITDHDLNITTCDGSFTALSGTTIYTSSGIYQDTLIDSTGCQLTYTYDLIIDQEGAYTNNIVSCSTIPDPDGGVYNSSGTYIDSLSTINGCDSVVTTNLTYTPYFGTQNITTCVEMMSPSGNGVYTTSGIYLDTLSTDGGCDSILTINLTIIPVDTSVIFIDPYLFAVATSAQYLWFDCDLNSSITLATDQYYFPQTNGNYSVIITENGCIDTSACYSISTVGLQEDESNFVLFPNPVVDELTILFGSIQSDLNVQIYNAIGGLLYAENVLSSDRVVIDFDLVSGTYFVACSLTDGTTEVYKVIKQ